MLENILPVELLHGQAHVNVGDTLHLLLHNQHVPACLDLGGRLFENESAQLMLGNFFVESMDLGL